MAAVGRGGRQPKHANLICHIAAPHVRPSSLSSVLITLGVKRSATKTEASVN